MFVEGSLRVKRAQQKCVREECAFVGSEFVGGGCPRGRGLPGCTGTAIVRVRASLGKVGVGPEVTVSLIIVLPLSVQLFSSDLCQGHNR